MLKGSCTHLPKMESVRVKMALISSLVVLSSLTPPAPAGRSASGSAMPI